MENKITAKMAFIASITFFAFYVLTGFIKKVRTIDFKTPKDMWE